MLGCWTMFRIPRNQRGSQAPRHKKQHKRTLRLVKANTPVVNDDNKNSSLEENQYYEEFCIFLLMRPRFYQVC